MSGAAGVPTNSPEHARRNPTLHLSIAHALKTIGRQQEAIDSYRPPRPIRPSYGDAYWSLANLKTYRFTDEEIAQDARARGGSERPRWSIATICALRSARRSRTAATTPNRSATTSAATPSRRAKSAIDPEQTRAQYRGCRQTVCTREFFAARRGVGYDSAGRRSSSSDCRGRARRCSSRSSRRIPRWRARWSWRKFRAWCSDLQRPRIATMRRRAIPASCTK